MAMIILGLDPGIARTGYGIIDIHTQAQLVRCGVLTTSARADSADRLKELGSDLEKIVKSAKPDRAVVEQVFFGANSKTAIQTAHVRGVLLYVLRQNHIPVASLTPLQIKSQLTGYGRATKSQVQHLVTMRLNLDSAPQPDDAADAVAAALCFADTTAHAPFNGRSSHANDL